MARYLEFSKTVVSKVSFCPELLRKEYRKCKAYLSEKERGHFERWINRQSFKSVLRE